MDMGCQDDNLIDNGRGTHRDRPSQSAMARQWLPKVLDRLKRAGKPVTIVEFDERGEGRVPAAICGAVIKLCSGTIRSYEVARGNGFTTALRPVDGLCDQWVADGFWSKDWEREAMSRPPAKIRKYRRRGPKKAKVMEEPMANTN